MNVHRTLCLGLFITLITPNVHAQTQPNGWEWGQNEEHALFSVDGFDGPEAVRYDSELDVYFVSCFNGATSGDANGYVSKVSSSGEILDLHFMTGTETYPFDAGRGMFITGDTLWVADYAGVHYFNKKSGQHMGFVDFGEHKQGFLNDITADKNGTLYVTNTRARALYKITNFEVEVVNNNLPVLPNGITTLPSGKLAIAPWQDGPMVYQIDPENGEITDFGATEGSDNFDGIEYFEGGLLTSAQADSALHLLVDGKDRVLIKLPGRPADIAVDPARKIVAVPFVALNQVYFWNLKKRL